MDGMLATPLAVLFELEFFRGFGFVFLGDIAEPLANGAFETENLAGSFFGHRGILP